MSNIGDTINSIMRGALNSFMPYPSVIANFATSNGTQQDFSPGGLLEKQMEVQMQMLVYSALSNMDRSDHEMKMTPVRNVRLS